MPSFALPCRGSLLLAVLLPALLATGCATQPERWAESRFLGLSLPALQSVALTTVSSEGYPVRPRDQRPGGFTSDWLYGTSQLAVRGPSRRRVIAEIVPDGGGLLLRLRVEEHVVVKGGMLAMHVRESEDWEPFPDNFDAAEFLVAKVSSLLSDYRVQPTGLPPLGTAPGAAPGAGGAPRP